MNGKNADGTISFKRNQIKEQLKVHFCITIDIKQTFYTFFTSSFLQNIYHSHTSKTIWAKQMLKTIKEILIW